MVIDTMVLVTKKDQILDLWLESMCVLIGLWGQLQLQNMQFFLLNKFDGVDNLICLMEQNPTVL